ncbi:MAG: hypothetical protein LW839_03720 [Cryomorphaceae bacterium]|jgi:hypothetical protein|nr:hypothetical protein [Cryomorphaceae bacterium]
MSPEQALALLHLNHQDPYEEQIEVILFELKQKIYRQLDQLLLYPKWIKELSRLDTAARTLGVGFPDEKLALFKEYKEVSDSKKLSMRAQFNAQYQIKVKISLLVYNGKSPLLLKELLEFWLEQQKDFFQYWAGAGIKDQEILLSKQFDPQQILGLLSELQKVEITSIEDLSNENTPLLLQQYIAWNKAVWSKLQDA